VGFFETFLTWLNAQLVQSLAQNVSRVAIAIEPAALALATIYVMVWGYLHLSGRIEEPLLDGARRIIILVVVLGVSLHLWAYNDVLVDTFFTAPGQLTAAILNAPRPLAAIDQLWTDAQAVAVSLSAEASLFGGHPTYSLVALGVYIVVGFTCVYATFLIALSLIAVALLLALGPLFIVLLLFDATRRFFESWIAQLATYALVSVLIALVAALLLSIVRAYATEAAAQGEGVTVSDAVRLCASAGLILLVMRQILPIAAGLGSGVALSSFNLISRSIGQLQRSTRRHSYLFMRGLMDNDTTRYDGLSRKAGYYARQATARLVRASWQKGRAALARRSRNADGRGT
jgi:type IV secretion system protein VirB6